MSASTPFDVLFSAKSHLSIILNELDYKHPGFRLCLHPRNQRLSAASSCRCSLGPPRPCRTFVLRRGGKSNKTPRLQSHPFMPTRFEPNPARTLSSGQLLRV